ncbi:MAG: hypothetical protein RIS70_3169 [Planctomycetota bacterium]
MPSSLTKMKQFVPHWVAMNRIPMNSTAIKAAARYFAALSALLVGVSGDSHGADDVASSLTIQAGNADRPAGPVRVSVDLPTALIQGNVMPSVKLKLASGEVIPGQVTPRSLLAIASKETKSTASELVFIAPAMKAGQALQADVLFGPATKTERDGFHWSDKDGKSRELAFAERPVMRYMYERLDNSTPERRGETYKIYHHVFDPRGTKLVTKGPGGLFPHHRGLFYGFNRIQYADGKKKADTWHCNNGEFQSHEQFVAEESGPVLGRHRLRIDWHGQDGAVFAQEERELTAYQIAGGTIIDFASRLTSMVGKVKLDGDPQHAGFQFRASQEVPDKTAKQTYYLRPDGKGEPEKFRNWDDKTRDPSTVNLPWLGLAFVLGDQRYTCLYIDRPENPKESRFSERDYGRFGCYFEYELDEGKPLELSYRVWLQEGEMSVEQARAVAGLFANPLTATWKK